MIDRFCIPLLTICLAGPGQTPADLEQLRATEQAVKQVVERATPWVVAIQTVGQADVQHPIGQAAGFRPAAGPSTGMIVSADGWIITSSFSFARSPAVVTVRLADGRRFVARPLPGGRLFARDHIRKLAIIKIHADDLPTPMWAPVDLLRVGQWAIALGWGQGGSRPAVSAGIISALDRHSGLAIQTDALLSPANYGGPLLDLDGRVMGICVPLGSSAGALAGVELYDSGVGFCITARQVGNAIERLMEGVDVEPGRLGVRLEASDQGVRISAVAEPSPANSADVRPGDIVLAIDRQPIEDLAYLRRLLRPRAAGEHVLLTIKRGDEERSLPLQLARPAEIGQFPQPPTQPATRPSSRPPQ